MHLARELNLRLVDVTNEIADVYFIDIDALFSLWGKRRLVEDQVTTWGHQGSLTALRDHWFAGAKVGPRAEALAAVDPARSLEAFGHTERFELEQLLAAELCKTLTVLWGIGRKKLVVCDLDNTLWPGVLADTGSPFGTEGAVSSSRMMFYPWLGIHEALRAVQQRGVLLACCSKNDEAVVRELWNYPEGSVASLLELDDFVALRINWQEKADNIVAIAEELNLGLSSVVFIDDNPIERDKVRQRLPDVTVLGDNLFTVRSTLLNDAAFQVPRVTDEARARSEMMKVEMLRKEAQGALEGDAYVKSLDVRIEVGRVSSDERLDRIAELVARTNQFNTTGVRYTKDELRAAMQGEGDRHLYAMSVADRFGSHGLVGACATTGDHVDLFVMSCRVIGLGVERVLLGTAVDAVLGRHAAVRGRFILTDRNTPARNLFRDAGFTEVEPGHWSLARAANAGSTIDAVRRLYTITSF